MNWMQLSLLTQTLYSAELENSAVLRLGLCSNSGSPVSHTVTAQKPGLTILVCELVIGAV